MKNLFKRSISAFLAMILIIANMCGVYASSLGSSIDSAAEKLLEYSSSDRENIFIMLNPLLSTDSGIDTLIEVYIDDYEPNAGGLFGNVLDKVFAKVTQDQARFVLYNIKLIDEDTRSDFLDGFQARKKISLTDETTEILEELISEYPNTEQLCKDDNITAGTIGYILSTLVEINDGKEFFDYNDGKFTVNYVNSSFKSGFNKNAQKTNQDVDFDDITDDIVASLNDMTSSEKSDAKTALAEIGVLKISSDNAVDDDDDKPSSTKKPTSSGSSGSGSGSSTAMTPIPSSKPAPTPSLTVKPTSDSAVQGGKVYKFDVPSENYTLKDKNGNPVKLSYIENGKLYAKLDDNSGYNAAEITVSFNDIDGWYKPYITELYSKGIVNGKSVTEFYPNDTVTREEFVKILCELLDLTAENGNTAFEDVPAEAWYAVYVNAAYNAKIVNGMSETEFGVGNSITRQDMAVMCANILKKYNISVSDVSELTFADTADISDYAADSVALLADLGIVNGDDMHCFNPKASLTRGESAKIATTLTKVLVNN